MAYSNILVGAGSRPAQPAVRKIGLADLRDALAKGADDFYAMPTHAIFLCIIYPFVGFALARLAFGYSILPLLYPLASGFALVGPIAALGLYELSRRREAGLETSATRAFDVFESSSIGAVAVLAILLLIIFVVWVAVADAIYVANFGYASPPSVGAFLKDVLTTRPGSNLIIVGAAVALLTSIRAVAHNPLTMMVWGLIVAALLVVGSLPLFFGLTVVMPLLGHATWHLYRKVVEPQAGLPPTLPEERKERRYAADFPSVLFPWTK